MIYFFFGIIITINFILIKYYKKFSKQLNLYDYPSKRKIHKEPTPLLGGSFFILNIFLYFLIGHILNLHDDLLFLQNQDKLFFLFFTFTVYLIGFIDDKIGLSPNKRLLILSLVFFLYLLLDHQLIIGELNFFLFDRLITIGSYDYIFTILCFLIFINACNMFDGINLQSSIYFIIFLLSFSLMTYFSIFSLFILVFLIFFSYLNYKGKIFFGDNGIYSISFVLSYIIIKNYNILNNINVEHILIIMIYPGLDMLRLVIERATKKKNPFKGDQRHLHHLILKSYGYHSAIIVITLMLFITNFLMIVGVNLIIVILLSILIYSSVILYFNYHN